MSNDNLHIERRAKKLPQYAAALSVNLGALACGGVVGWTSNISEDMKNIGYNQIQIDSNSLGWIGSTVFLGAIVFCLPTAYICNLLGRKKAMLFLTIPFSVGWLLIIFAKWLWMIYAGRFLTGAAFGGVCVIAPIYVSECTESSIRGTLGSSFQLLFTTGSLTAFALAMFLNMNLYTIISATFPLYFAFAMIFQPETPIYLASKNYDDKAIKSLIRLRGSLYNVHAELESIKRGIMGNQQNKVYLRDWIRKRAVIKATFICCTLMFLQQIGGLNAIIAYTSTIFSSTGVKIDAKLSTTIFGIVKVIGILLSSILIDKLGRRILLIGSNIGIGISVSALAIFFTLRYRINVEESIMAKLEFLPLTSLSLFIVSFALGMGPIPWILAAELFPSEVRSFGTATVTIINCFTGFLVTKFYFNLESAVGKDATFYLFSGVAFITLIFIYFFVPETKNKSLAEIQDELNKK